MLNGRVKSDVTVDRHHSRASPVSTVSHFVDSALGQREGLYHHTGDHYQTRGHDGHQAGHGHRRLQDEAAADADTYEADGYGDADAAEEGASDAGYEDAGGDAGYYYEEGYEDAYVEELPNYRTDMHFHDWEHGNTYSQEGHEHWEHLQTWDVPCGDENFRATQRAICISGVISLEDSRCTYRHEHDPERLLQHGHAHGDGWKHNTGYDGLGNGFGMGHEHEHEHVDPIPMTLILDDNDQGNMGDALLDGVAGAGNDGEHAHTGYGYQPVEGDVAEALDELTLEVAEVEDQIEGVEEAVENLEETVEDSIYAEDATAEAVEEVAAEVEAVEEAVEAPAEPAAQEAEEEAEQAEGEAEEGSSPATAYITILAVIMAAFSM